MEGKLATQLCQLATEVVEGSDIVTSTCLIPNDLKHIMDLCACLGHYRILLFL